MPLTVRPDYAGGSIVNLMASLVDALGGRAGEYGTLVGAALDEVRSARTVVLVVVDGLGDLWLDRFGRGGALASCRRASITSVFPSTTASAVTTFFTGLAPAQHALTGWHIYLREIGSVAAILPLTLRPGGQPLLTHGAGASTLFPHEPVFDRIGVESTIILPQWIVNSAFTVAHAGRAGRLGYRGVEGMFEAIAAVARTGTDRQFVYAYHPEIDSLAHAHGMASDAVRAEFSRLEAAWERLFDAIRGTDTAVVLTADHGFVDTRPDTVIDLADHPALSETLMLPLCGEPRVAYCYVRDGRAGAFERYVADALADRGMLFRSDDLVAEGLFGPGTPDPRLADRIGDYTLVMRDNYVIRDHLLGERRHPQIGVHGGATPDEMQVPLVVAHA
ncbi:MAG: alkaline phosphatase family protein [Burkholderiales bacterium]|jgi:hypothetical protein|nr:alkaline phosphatase family protein [Burkholderiales bacterium]